MWNSFLTNWYSTHFSKPTKWPCHLHTLLQSSTAFPELFSIKHDSKTCILAKWQNFILWVLDFPDTLYKVTWSHHVVQTGGHTATKTWRHYIPSLMNSWRQSVTKMTTLLRKDGSELYWNKSQRHFCILKFWNYIILTKNSHTKKWKHICGSARK